MIVDKEDTLVRYNEWPDHFEACVAGLLNCENTARKNDNDRMLRMCDSIRRQLEGYTLVIFNDAPECAEDADGNYDIKYVRLSMPLRVLAEFESLKFYDWYDRFKTEAHEYCHELYAKAAEKSRAYWAERAAQEAAMTAAEEARRRRVAEDCALVGPYLASRVGEAVSRKDVMEATGLDRSRVTLAENKLRADGLLKTDSGHGARVIVACVWSKSDDSDGE